jgi:hypothetical protein
MRDDRIYELRQAILEAHVYYTPGIPLTLDDLMRFYRLPFLRVTRDQVAEEWGNLLINGYVESMPDSNGAYRRITATGLNQINREVKLDVYLWGRQALMILAVTFTIFMLFTTSVGGRPAFAPGGHRGPQPAVCSGGPRGGASCARSR